jgi:uncharacterized protein (TIGR00266 family)
LFEKGGFFMQYQIKGDTLPVAICHLSPGESLISEAGAMGWMSDNIIMDTNMKGGLFGGIGRAFSGESVFLNTFTCQGSDGIIAFPSSVPGKIIARHLAPGETIICQKDAFLAGDPSVELKVHFKKRLGAGLFGGEGFILQRITGPGITFLELDGHIEEYSLAPGQRLIADTGSVAFFDASVHFDIQMVKGFKNILFGGEGLFLTTLTGPGKVYLQSMPVQSLASRILSFMPTSSK